MADLTRVSKLVDTLGEADFEQTFFDTFDNLLGLWSCTAFEFRRDSAPKCILAAASNRQSNQRVRSNAERYVRSGYIDDPNLKFTREHVGSEVEIRSLADVNFDDDSYRTRYFGRASTRDKIFFSVVDGDQLIYLNFYRGNFQESFDEKEKLLLRDYVPLVISLLKQHMKLVELLAKPKATFFEETKTQRRARYEQVYELLSAYGISPRESQVCAMIVVGHTTEGIGIALEISKNTVITHRRRAYEKLGISNQNELFGKCFDNLAQIRQQH
jgi:DNA-binding CsgD family transcriptional regulator